MTKSRIFLFLLIAFVAGVGFTSFFEIPIFLIWFAFLAASSGAASAILKNQRKNIFLSFLMFSFLAGILRFVSVQNKELDLSLFYNQNLEIRGVVWEEPEFTENSERLKIKISEIDSREIKNDFFTLVILQKYSGFSLGDDLIIRGKFQKPENFNDFDYISYLAKDNIFSLVSFPKIEKIGDKQGSKLKFFLSRSKNSFEEKLDRVLPEPHTSFLKGLILGQRQSLPKDMKENFKKTGTTHIIALSGYNITLVSRFFVESLLFLTVPFQISFWIAVLAISLFVALTGASPSVVRAGIMGILVLLAQKESRGYRIINALVFAAAAMIFYNPKILRFDAAFQLSFMATVGLIYLSPILNGWINKVKFSALRKFYDAEYAKEKEWRVKMDLDSIPRNGLQRVLVETLSAQIMVLPLLIYIFGTVSVISPITNILVITAVPFSMTLGFITGGLGFIWQPLSNISGFINWIFLEYKIIIIEYFAKFPFSVVTLPKISIVWLFIIYGTFIYFLWRKKV